MYYQRNGTNLIVLQQMSEWIIKTWYVYKTRLFTSNKMKS